ncbi:hypothetical protein C9374_011493 [Naegleria lovaniensis]|uniref:Uncharacterized protein n=1 Tax=Naegleria lovaniensis TaxID=51637 RepID=A0AA88KP38_NAELO|nr:uncharacterized protein C9374_011493 [Naegleria lovaniensis]KAG2392768.1 hypothetical protein C9374_011493 [Naegleria lovaniensis]
MQHIYYYDHGMFVAPTKNMITVYNKLYSEYIDFDDFKKLPFDVILYILTFIKFPEIIFYSKKLIETAHYSDLYEKMLLYEETASSMSNLKELTSDTTSPFTVFSSSTNATNHSTISSSNDTSSTLHPVKKSSSSASLHKRSISPSSASLTKSIPFSLHNVMSKLFGVFEKERNQRLFLFDFYAHLKFIGFDQMLALYNSFYRDYSSASYNSIFLNNSNTNINTNTHNNTNTQQDWNSPSHDRTGHDHHYSQNTTNTNRSIFTTSHANSSNPIHPSSNSQLLSSTSSFRVQEHSQSFTHSSSSFQQQQQPSSSILMNAMLSPRSSCRRLRISYDDDFLSMLTASPNSFEHLLGNHANQTSTLLLGDFTEESNVWNSRQQSNALSLHSHLPKHLRHVVKSVKRISNEYQQQQQQQSMNMLGMMNNNGNQQQQQRRRSKSLGSSQIAIQIRKKIEEPINNTNEISILEDNEQQDGSDVTTPQDSTRSKHRFSIQFYQVRNYFYIPYIQSVTFSNCSNQANYYIHFVVLPFFTFNNHLKSFKLIDCQLSQETIQELYFQLRSMFVEMHKNGKLTAPYYSSLRELSLADNDLFHYCSWHFLFPNLRTLDLSGNKSMMGPSMCKLLTKDIESFKHLKRLNLSNGAFDSNMIIRSNSLRELDVFDIRQPMNTTQLENQIVNHCKKIRLIKYYSAQEKKLVKWVREDDY